MKLNAASQYRDGTSQRHRLLTALAPDYFVVDDRTLHDVIQFAQAYAKELRFYESGQITPTDWTGFLPTDKQFIEDAVRFIKQPEAIVDLDRRMALMQPHRVLFWVFLLLLRYPQQQLNALTQRYLEFYYRDCLQLREKPPQPDRAHVIFELAPSQQAYCLKEGILLSTEQGQSDSAAPIYRLDRDSVITSAQVAKICALALKKEVYDFATFYHPGKTSDNDFAALLQWVLERAAQQVAMPAGFENAAPTPSIDLPSLKMLAEQDQLKGKQKDYIEEELAFHDVNDFKMCLQGHRLQTAEQTDQIHKMMERVYQKKIALQRYQALEHKHRNGNFINMLAFALGAPLPTLPSPHTAITSLKTDLTHPAVMDYINKKLYMTIKDFEKIIDIVIKAPDINSKDWKEVYQLVQGAQTLKQRYPDIRIEKTTHLCTRVMLDAELKEHKPFKTFDWSATDTPALLGFAVSSPLLRLGEGRRKITLTVDCQRDTFHLDRLNKFVQQSPFTFQLSGAETHFAPSSATVTAGHFFLATALAEYDTNTLALICRFKGEKGQFNSERDKDNYLQFEDGQLYQITEVMSAQHAKLRPVGFLPSKGFIKKYPELTLTGTGSPLSGLALEEMPVTEGIGGKTRKIITANSNLFTVKDHFKQYILWTDGRVYRIEHRVNANKIEVVEVAYLPDIKPKPAAPRLYPDIQLTETKILTGLVIDGVAANNEQFTEKEVGNWLVWSNGQVFAIQKQVGNQEVKVACRGQLPPNTKIEKYAADALFLNGLQFTFDLNETAPAMTAPLIDVSHQGLTGVDPTIKITLKAGGDYDLFKMIIVEKYKLAVNVQGIKDVKRRNDASLLTNTVLLQPFGDQPTAHAGFYWAHSEICDNALDSLDLGITWSGLPEDFGTHYAAYKKFLSKKIDNTSFQTQLTVVNNRVVTAIGTPQCLFSVDPNSKKLTAHTCLQFKNLPKLGEEEVNRFTHNDPDEEDPMAWSRYFKLALTEQDFLHDQYATVLNKSALAPPTEGKSVPNVYPPYTPLIRDLTLNYTASALINLAHPAHNAINEAQLFQLHPFGSKVLGHNVNQLLPQFSAAGYLYMGLKDATVPAPLSLLFQIIPSESDKLEESADMTYHYLGQHDWVAADSSTYFHDETKGLMHSGVMSFHLPAAASHENPLMPTGLHWLCGSVNQEVVSPQIVAIKTQAATVTLAKGANDEHHRKPLPAYSINQLVTADPQIKAVTQPYASFGGRARENHQAFWQRTSERLRHKQRAISSWDYERLVLAAFPQLYKVKCLTQTQLSASPLAKVTVVVIPDNANNSEPFLLLKPKASRDLLEAIKVYLSQYISPFVDLEVKNPSYEQIKYRVTVRFKKADEPGNDIAELNKAIKRFLSPWAYESTAEVTFGSYIHNSLLIHFIEKQPYVDYVAQLRLIEHIKLDSDLTASNTVYSILDVDQAQAQVHALDAVLVSAPEHIIELVTMHQHEDIYFEGIGHMIIETDFIVH
ncbi:baseplate J/gp47 family protein [Candidatus Fukatsuia symbiotica]|uniref:baseplate J/gp47 family protein n=1 Tax=Candidatus Fukatsuia symbiotica TaxID=1878942 RepID=UPI000E7572EA|nr:baseplate J/gp47 family protein [Candidatus Fukatsuia symbiotica]MEA9443908.1 baseplate J/gp47 family protein [Candidatus Fukatsuia symbiotica]